jgi:hypothetical protein
MRAMTGRPLLVGLWLLLSACAAPAPVGPAVTLDQDAGTHLKTYLRTMGSDNFGAFAVSPNGHYAYYTYCTDGANCERVPLNFDALAGCKKLAGADCILLAHNRQILRLYRVAG